MQDLEPPDSHHLNAALGWLDLGNPSEAQAELEKICPASLRNPDVLDTFWRVHAQKKDWPAALTAAQQLLEIAPDNPAGWINQSYALHEMRRTEEAWNHLWQVSKNFPDIAIIYYNLACYACQLGRNEDAKELLNRAILLRSKAEIKLMALNDADLKPLREYVENL